MSNYEEYIKMNNYQQNEEETCFNEHDEDTPSTPKNIYKSIYDDEDFEQDTQWESKGMYDEISTFRRKMKNQVTGTRTTTTVGEVKQVQEEPEKVLNLPKGGWNIQKVEIDAPDFSSPIPSKVAF